MLIMHKPRVPWDLGSVDFSTWQPFIEALVMHILEQHLDQHDDQQPDDDKTQFLFNREGFHTQEMRLLYGP